MSGEDITNATEIESTPDAPAAPEDPFSLESEEAAAREAGLLPDASTEEATPEPEPKPVRYAEAREAIEAVGGDQDELDEFLGKNQDLKEHLRALPGWTAGRSWVAARSRPPYDDFAKAQ